MLTREENNLMESLENLPVTDLIHMRLPEAEARQWLLRLTPERITPALLDRLVATVREAVSPIPDPGMAVMDCCGTGGSGLPHYNTSTTVAFILAAGGVPVVKFGNRALSSQSGSFDFLEALGIPVETPLEALPEILSACGLAFLYAPQCYPCLAPFNRLRRELGVRTVFNFMGPLLNPVQPAWRLTGVSHAGMQTLMADHLTRHAPGLKRAWFVHGFLNASDPDSLPAGLDEILPNGVTRVLEVSAGAPVHEVRLDRCFVPEAADWSEVAQPDPARNANVFYALINGKDTRSPEYEAVCLNAGAGFYVAERADDLEAGVLLARRLLGTGLVRQTWEQCRRIYARF